MHGSTQHRPGQQDGNAAPSTGETTPYGKAAMDNEARLVTEAPEGTRNGVLNKAAYSLGTIIAAGYLNEAEAYEALTQAVKSWGEGIKRKDTTKITEGIEAGKEHPRIGINPAGRRGRHPQPAPRPTMPTPKTLDPAALGLLAAVWQAIQWAPLQPAALAWCKKRGLDPQTVYDAGCRDWSARVADLRPPLDTDGTYAAFKALEGAGMAYLDNYDKPRLWAPYDDLVNRAEGQRRLEGLAIPVWHPDYPHPVAWRWRIFNPQDDKKELACFKTNPYCSGSLGLLVPAESLHYALPDAENLRCAPIRGAVGADLAVVVEGTPDWLSVLDVLAHDHPKQSIGVIGLPGNGVRPSAAAFEVLADVARRRGVVLLVHDKAKNLVLTMAKEIAKRAGKGHVQAAVVPEGQDLNDLHKSSQLAALIKRYAEKT